MPGTTVSIYFKKQMRLDRLNFNQMQMFKLGTVAVANVINRVTAALGPDDTPAKPLQKGYAIQKTRRGLGNRRNLTYTGDMLRNLSVRSVSENKASANVTTRDNRIKAAANQRKEQWLVHSPKNQIAVTNAARIMLNNEIRPRLLLAAAIGASPYQTGK